MSLDSLMDALTNVVGILVIILIFAVVGGQEAVKRIKGFVDEISEEQLADKAAESEELRKLVEAQRAKWEELDARAPEYKLTIEEQQRLLEQLRADIAQLSGTQIDPDELKKQLEERRKRVAELETKTREQEQLLASLKARLAETPAQGAMADTKVVNLPDPRPAPEGAQKVTVLCRGGRLYPVDEKGLQKEAQQVLVGARRTLEKEGRIDCEKLADLFEKRFVGNRLFRLGVRQGGDGKPQLLVQPREEAGEETEAVSKRTSLFNQALRQLNPAKQYIEFRVWSDSFDTYLAARNEAARAGILAGWTPYTETADFSMAFGIDFNTTCAGYTPPPPRPAAPPDPNRPPPPPADVVD
jgi:hypothetical protein